MPRKAFLADVASAASSSLPNISELSRGDDDGDIDFIFTPPTGARITIGLLALDVSEYPSGNSFMIFTKSSDVPARANSAIEDVANCSTGMRVEELVLAIASKLQSVLATGSKDGSSDVEMPDSVVLDDDQFHGDAQESEEEEEDAYDDGFSDDGFEPFGPSTGRSSNTGSRLTPEAAAKLNRRIKSDLRAVKFSRFKVGILSGMTADSHSCLVSISIQGSRLGLSEEALHAWDLEPEQYVVLLIRYSSGYKTFEAVISEPAKSLDIAFRVGVCDKYKPTVSQALAAFSDHTKDTLHDTLDQNQGTSAPKLTMLTGIFSSLFISSAMDEFTNDQFISLVKIRNNVGLGWDGAKLFYNDRLGRQDEKNAELPENYFEESDPKNSSLPEMMTADHLTDVGIKEISFPLIAVQFTMRYLLRCTEFCLVCHDKTDGDFEALKPYVCNKPLCLYQYMSLGFGPSIEHEILSQPHVVDLLVSFCYAAAHNQRIREYPTGMSLAVPNAVVSVTITQSMRHVYGETPEPKQPPPEAPASFEVRLDQAHNEIIFDGIASCPVRNGDWVMLVFGNSCLHFRVNDISLYPTVKLSDTPVIANGATTSNTLKIDPATPATTPPPPALITAKMMKYDQNFDDMTNVQKAETIVLLLGTLPSVKELRTYLLQQSHSKIPNLRQWKDRISPAALGLLRWIIASNRSSIVQVDTISTQVDAENMTSKVREDQKCANIAEGWMQFRFAQGSPDKEQRFLDALKAEQASLDAKHPTLFAWHGSPLQNWHSIIRHGLDFAETLHGRAYGNGVYHAMDQTTSTGYASQAMFSWPGSELNIRSAMSLNEIVNCPTKFQSRSPYLVVQHVDWIQCRYLMVQNTNSTNTYQNAAPVVSNEEAETPDGHVHQDPKFTARATTGKAVGIPLCAVSISKAFRANAQVEQVASKPGFLTSILGSNKRHKSSVTKGLLVTDGAASDDEDIEDINFLFSEDEVKCEGNEKAMVGPKLTGFVAGALDQSTLPMLNAPAYATPAATLRLNKELMTIYKIQESTPLHELGWYINQELISNVYQWIVELHSFEETLPLAKDMKAAGVTSIVLELRFGKDYPHSPPFVRVIRPKFVPFSSGGGGHVTIGGALCMELLTNSGWSAVSSIESVLLQVRMAIMNLEPKPARLMNPTPTAQNINQDYSTGEAVAAYIRACQAHGWEVPKDFNDFANGISNTGMY